MEAPIIPAAVLDGDSEEEVEHEVRRDDHAAEGAHDPVEDAHVHLHELPLDEARILVHDVVSSRAVVADLQGCKSSFSNGTTG